MPTSHEREQVLFTSAVAKPPAERAAFLERECAGDAALRARLEALLAAHDEPDELLATQPESAKPTITLDFANAAADTAVGSTIGRYKLLEKIGEGGCGVVYVAEQTEPVRRRVALKVIKLGMDTKAVVARFEAERQALAMMDHPNIAKVLDAGTTEGRLSSRPEEGNKDVPAAVAAGRPYFVMELVRGIRITDYCDRNNLSTKERIDLFAKVCQAIQHAHQKGIIHRDIKPSNILVTLHDGVPVPKVIDFGIAKAMEGRLTDATVYTQLHQFLGTPAYMSPEQAEMSGLDIDTRSDIYSLGVLLYELLAGRTPFDAKELVAHGLEVMRKRIREEEPVRPSTRLATLQGEELTATARRRSADAPKLIHLLKGDLDSIVMKCLEKDRTRRYETANGLAADLERHLNNEPVIARPPSAAYRIQKAIRRNKLAYAAAAIVAVVLVLGIIVSVRFAQQEARARREAEDSRKKEVDERRKAMRLAEREAEATAEAQKQRNRAERAVTQTQIQSADAWFDADDAPAGIAQLASTLRGNPGNSSVAERLMHALAYNNFAEPLRQLSSLTNLGGSEFKGRLQFGADGRRFVSVDSNGSVGLWDTISRRPLNANLATKGRVRKLQFAARGRVLVAISEQEGSRAGKPTIDSGADILAKSTDAPRPNALFSQGLMPVEGLGRPPAPPTGLRIVSDSTEPPITNYIQLWDGGTGSRIGIPLAHEGQVRFTETSSDGRRVFTISAEGRTRLWDSENGEGRALQEHQEHVIAASAAFSADGHRLITTLSDGRTVLWDPATGRALYRVTGPPSPHIVMSEFSPDSRVVVSVYEDGTAALWDVETGHVRGEPLRDRTPIRQVLFSPDGKVLLTISNEGTARSWDVQTATELAQIRASAGAMETFRFVRFSANGDMVLTVSPDGSARIFDSNSGLPVSERIIARGLAPIVEAFFLQDGRHLVTFLADYSGLVWDISPKSLVSELRPAERDTASVCLSSEGGRAITVSSQGIAEVWELGASRLLFRLRPTVEPDVPSFPPSPLAVSQFPVSTKPEAEENTVRRMFPLLDASFSSDGQSISAISSDGTISTWNSSTGSEILNQGVQLAHDLDFGQRASQRLLRTAKFGRGLDRVTAVTSDNALGVWDCTTGQSLCALVDCEDAVRSVELSADGLRILALSVEGRARVWEIRGTQLVSKRLREDDVLNAQFSPDSLRIVTVSSNGRARLWDSGTGEPIMDPLPRKEGFVWATFGNGANQLLTVSAGGHVQSWNLGFEQPMSETIFRLTKVSRIQFEPNGHRIVMLSDRAIQILSYPPVPPSVEPWMVDLAEAIAGKRLDDLRNISLVSIERFWQARQELAQRSTSDPFTRWAKRLLADGTPDRRLLDAPSTSSR